MARNGSGIYSPPAGTTATAGTAIESAKYNAFVNDLTADLNLARPIVAGGTGATTAGAALTNLGAQPADADLTAIAGLSSNGIVTRTGAGTAAARTIAGGTFISVTNGDGVSGNPSLDIPASAVRASSEGTGTLLDTELATALWVQEAIRALTLVRGAQISATSGTFVEATSLPSWIRRITLNFRGVSTTGTTVPFLQLGTSGGYLTTGYSGAAVAASGGVGTLGGAGLPIWGETSAGASHHGKLIITRAEGNIWSFSGAIGRSDSVQVNVMGGTVDLGGTLDRLRLIISGGQAFDAGFINLVTE